MSTTMIKTKNKIGALEIVYVGMFSALMMIGANITSFVPFLIIGGVPITLQLFFAILAGTILGGRLGAISMAVYAFIGLVGAPVFARFGGGPGSILNPTFGFVLAFIVTAYVAGKMVEKNKQIYMFVLAALVATAVNYLLGTNWMYAAYKLWFSAPEGFTYQVAWMWMALPLVKDIILAIIAGMFAYRMAGIVKRTSTLH